MSSEPIVDLNSLITLASVCVAAIAVYLSKKSRVDSLRDKLHSEQLGLVRDFSERLYLCTEKALMILREQDEDARDTCRKESVSLLDELQKHVFHARFLMPAKVSECLTKEVALLTRCIFPEAPGFNLPSRGELVSAFRELVNAVRAELKIDALTTEYQLPFTDR